MKIAVLNAGSGTQRCSLFDLDEAPSSAAEPGEPVWEAMLDSTAPDQPAGKLRVTVRDHGATANDDSIDGALAPAERSAQLLRRIWHGAGAPLKSPAEIDAIGHRIVHGADRFAGAVRVDAEVEGAIERLSVFAPLHNPVGLSGIRAARELTGDTVQIAVFDTAFHRTLPRPAATYAGPHAWWELGIRRYGFHGSNFRWVADRTADLLGRSDDSTLPLILCHVGGGCSLCATRGGQSIDTTMGFTPLDGVAMSTRSGAVDPGILVYLQRQGRTADEIETLLNRESGLKGLSGISGDTRILLPKMQAGDPRAELAWRVFIHRLRSGIGQMLATLGERPAALVFTDAIAEDVPELRAELCAPFGFLGLELDAEKNRHAVPDAELTSRTSVVKAWLVKSREAWQIARECRDLLIGV